MITKKLLRFYNHIELISWVKIYILLSLIVNMNHSESQQSNQPNALFITYRIRHYYYENKIKMFISKGRWRNVYPELWLHNGRNHLKIELKNIFRFNFFFSFFTRFIAAKLFLKKNRILWKMQMHIEPTIYGIKLINQFNKRQTQANISQNLVWNKCLFIIKYCARFYYATYIYGYGQELCSL